MTASDAIVGMCHQCETRHLDPDEHEDRAERVREVVEALPRVAEQEVHRAEPEDRERVRREHDERLA